MIIFLDDCVNHNLAYDIATRITTHNHRLLDTCLFVLGGTLLLVCAIHSRIKIGTWQLVQVTCKTAKNHFHETDDMLARNNVSRCLAPGRHEHAPA